MNLRRAGILAAMCALALMLGASTTDGKKRKARGWSSKVTLALPAPTVSPKKCRGDTGPRITLG
jgi:hypothetical protein